MTTTHRMVPAPTATRDEVWFTITAATSGNPLGPHLPPPVSVNLYAKTCGVTLTFDAIENARAWARWLGVEDTESVNSTAGVFWCDVTEKRCGWYWSIAVYAHDMRQEEPPVPCGRCGHETRGHDGALCIECPDTRCQAVVLVPAGVDGWPIDGRAT